MGAQALLLGYGGGGGGVPTVTWNPSDKHADIALSGGNLIATLTGANGARRAVRGTVGRSSGTVSFEVTVGTTNFKSVGVATTDASLAGVEYYPGKDVHGYGWQQGSLNKEHNGTTASYGTAHTDGDVIRCEIDFSAGTITFYKNGVSQGIAFSGIIAATYYPCVGIANNGGSYTADFTNW